MKTNQESLFLMKVILEISRAIGFKFRLNGCFDRRIQYSQDKVHHSQVDLPRLK